MVWIKDNAPKEDGFFWVTIGGITWESPCQYSTLCKHWFDRFGDIIENEKIDAYLKIDKPKSFNTIGTGFGYYIMVDRSDYISFYGKGLNTNASIGYETLDRAKSACRRLMNIEKDDGCEYYYKIVDGEKNVVYKFNK